MDLQQAQLNADFSNKAYNSYKQQNIGNTFAGTDGKTGSSAECVG